MLCAAWYVVDQAKNKLLDPPLVLAGNFHFTNFQDCVDTSVGQWGQRPTTFQFAGLAAAAAQPGAPETGFSLPAALISDCRWHPGRLVL